MSQIETVYQRMMEYYKNDPRRIQHFVKVHSFARLIGLAEGLDEPQQITLEMAALMHDIGIKVGEETLGLCDGKTQERLGPPVAETMLLQLAVEPARIQRICYLISRHHTYTNVDGIDYRILLESDSLVNLYEDGEAPEAVRSAYDSIFCTETGRRLCRLMFGINDAQETQ